MNLRSDYHKVAHGQQRKKSGQLTAQQQWKLEHLSYLKPYYKQCHKSGNTGALGGPAITPTEHESDDEHEHEHEERGHESSSSSRKETPTKIPVLSSPLPLRKPKKRRDTDKEEKASSFNELMDVMKESASHLVSQCARSANHHDRERDSFFLWLNDFTSRMPRQNWDDFQRTTVNLAMQYTPADSPQTKHIKAKNTTGSFCFTCPSPDGPSAKTSTKNFWWLCGDATVAAVRWGSESTSNGEQLSVIVFKIVFTVCRNDFLFYDTKLLLAHCYVVFGFCH